MIRVYHVKNPTFMPSNTGVKMSDLHLVAEVETTDLNVAYELTNTINGPWWENEGVKFLGSPDYGMDGCRSTSVGDVLIRKVPESTITRYFIVDSIGFTEVEHIS